MTFLRPNVCVHNSRTGLVPLSVIVSVLAGCIPPPPLADDDAGEGADAGTTDAGFICAGFPREECEMRDGCEFASGYVETAYCGGDFSQFTPAGCMPFADGCNEAVTCVVTPEGQRIIFSNSCVPPEMERCEPCE